MNQLSRRYELAQRGIVIRSINPETGEGYAAYPKLLMRHLMAVVTDNIDAARAIIEAAFAKRPDILNWLTNASPNNETE